MKAIVCDRCGKVMLLADGEEMGHSVFRDCTYWPARIGKDYELCEDCTNEFFYPKEKDNERKAD